jgi:hypothetical protein
MYKYKRYSKKLTRGILKSVSLFTLLLISSDLVYDLWLAVIEGKYHEIKGRQMFLMPALNT